MTVLLMRLRGLALIQLGRRLFSIGSGQGVELSTVALRHQLVGDLMDRGGPAAGAAAAVAAAAALRHVQTVGPRRQADGVAGRRLVLGRRGLRGRVDVEGGLVAPGVGPGQAVLALVRVRVVMVPLGLKGGPAGTAAAATGPWPPRFFRRLPFFVPEEQRCLSKKN